MKTRITRNIIVTRMWASGRPATDNRYADIYFTAVKAGLTSDQALSLACVAYDAKEGFVERLSQSQGSLRRVTLERKASDPDSPQSLWAYLKAANPKWPYITDQDIRDTSINDYGGWKAWADQQRAEQDQNPAEWTEIQQIGGV